MITEMTVMNKPVKTLLDTGAAINVVTEEFLVGLLNLVAAKGTAPTDPMYPILQMESWSEEEQVNGVAKRTPVALLGAVVLRVGLGRVGAREMPVVPVRCKIFKGGACEWHGLILGGRTLDAQSRGGLGLRITEDAYVLEAHGVVLPRLEDGEERPDRAYGLWGCMVAAACLAGSGSAFDSDSDGEKGSQASEGSGTEDVVGPLVYSGDPLVLEPEEGAWVWAECLRRPGAPGDSAKVEAVMASKTAAAEVVPGLWTVGADSGLVFVGNASEFDVALEQGDRIGILVAGAAQTRH